MDENRKKALAAALGQIEKQFGKGSVMRLGDAGPSRDIEAISTGCLGLDIALGIGGLPKGRVVEIYGPESSGKTTMTLQVVAEFDGGRHHHTTPIVGRMFTLFGVPFQVQLVGNGTGNARTAIVAAQANQHDADFGDFAFGFELHLRGDGLDDIAFDDSGFVAVQDHGKRCVCEI